MLPLAVAAASPAAADGDLTGLLVLPLLKAAPAEDTKGLAGHGSSPLPAAAAAEPELAAGVAADGLLLWGDGCW